MAGESSTQRPHENSNGPFTRILRAGLDVIVGLAVLYLFLRKDVERP